jgi:hypothetical protein
MARCASINSSRQYKGDTNAQSSFNQDNPHSPRPATQLQKHTTRLCAPHLPFLIRVGQLVVERLDALGFGGPLRPFCGVGQAGDEVGDGTGGEELVGTVVERFGGERGRRVRFRGDLEDGLEDVDVV